MKSNKVFLLAVLGGLVGEGVAGADPDQTTDPPPVSSDDYAPVVESPGVYSYAWSEPRLKSSIGVGVALGGGFSGFTDQTMRNTMSSNANGLWDARVAIGTHIPIGLELGYLGTAGDIKTLGGAPNGTLVGTTFEATARYNILPHNNVNPYVFAGVGAQRYDLTQAKLTTSDSGIQTSDNLAEFPMGAGLSYRDTSGLTVDLRGTFRAATSSTLVLDQNGGFANLHTWEGSAGLGYEF